MSRWHMQWLVLVLSAALFGCNAAVNNTRVDDTTVMQSQSPAPPDARFTPNLTWDGIRELPKLWGIKWASTREWDEQVVRIYNIKLVPPLKPQYMRMYENFIRRAEEGRAEFRFGGCYPNGVPRSFWFTSAPNFIFPPGNSLLLNSFGETREIFMDGRGHPADLDSSDPSIAYLGHSVGWWEGETLVVDTVGFAPEHELFYDVPNGGDMHVVERFTLIEPQVLETRLIVDDPARLEKPWHVTRLYFDDPAVPGLTMRSTGSSIDTIRCRPGYAREVFDESGDVFLDLTPPPEGLGIGSGD